MAVNKTPWRPLAPMGATQLPKVFSTNEVKSAFATILVYSMPRFGKTDLIRSLVKHDFKPIIIATDQGDSMGLKTISDLDVPVVPVTTWDEAVVVFAELNKDRGEGNLPRYGDFEFNVVVNDSLSGFGGIWMDKALDVMGRDEVGVAEKGWDPRRVYAYIPEKGRQTTKALGNVKAHLLLIARETMITEGQGDAMIRYPAPEMPGEKLPRELPGWLDAVVFGKIVGGERKFLTQAEGRIVAGIREPPAWRLPAYIPADYGLLIKYMMGDRDAFNALAHPPSKTSTVPKAASTQSPTPAAGVKP